jgi:hypothetical protein
VFIPEDDENPFGRLADPEHDIDPLTHVLVMISAG